MNGIKDLFKTARFEQTIDEYEDEIGEWLAEIRMEYARLDYQSDRDVALENQ